MNKERLVSCIVSTACAAGLGLIALFSLKNLFELLSFTPAGAWLLGTSIALFPAFFLNRLLTREYLKTCDVDEAGEFSSFSGTFGTICLAIIIGLGLGCAGTKGTKALISGIHQTGYTTGLLKSHSGSPALDLPKTFSTSSQHPLQKSADACVESEQAYEAIPPLTEDKQKRTVPESIRNSGSGSVTIFY